MSRKHGYQNKSHVLRSEELLKTLLVINKWFAIEKRQLIFLRYGAYKQDSPYFSKTVAP